MNSKRKITEPTIVNSLKNLSPKQQQLFLGFMRYVGLPMILIAWLHFFEMHSYAWDPFDIMNFGMLITTSITLYYMILFVYHTAPYWQVKLLKRILYGIGIFILFGFLYQFLERDYPYFTLSEVESIEEKLAKSKDLSSIDLKKLKITEEYYILGKESKRIHSFIFYGIKSRDLTFDQQFEVYEKEIIPKDFRTYRSYITSSGNNTSDQLIKDYLGWQFPRYKPYIYIYSLQCENPNYPINSEEENSNCSFFYGENSNPNILSLKPLLEQGLFTRLTMYYAAIEEVFFPTYVREDLKDDPYFLIEQGKFKEAKAGLSKLPEERRLFCEAKLKALGKW